MKAFLQFMYCDTLPPDSIDCQLLLAADRYCFDRLVEVCVNGLIEMITSENVVEIMYKAYLIENRKLLDVCSSFMIANRGKIEKGPLWDEIEANNPRVWTKIMEKIFFDEYDDTEV